MELIQTQQSPNSKVIWISPLFGVELKIDVSGRSISALKRFIEVLEYNPDDRLSLDDYVILEDVIRGSDIALAKEAMNAHVHVNVDNKCDPPLAEFIPEIKKIESSDITPIKTDIFKEELKNRVKESYKVFTEIEPFKEAPSFVYHQTDLLKQVGKNAVFCNNHDGIIAIWRAQYKINIFTTIEEIKRMKSLPEMTVKLTLQDYEKRTYPNKAVVLRHFLRDLKDVNELNIEIAPKPHKPIPTFSKMSDLDKI